MDGIIPHLRFAAKQRFIRRMTKCKDGKLKTRYLIVNSLMIGRTVAETAQIMQVARSTVYEVAKRFREQGELGLLDRREDNGEIKLDEAFLSSLSQVVRCNPGQHGWMRPSWTREMLVATMQKETGVRISRSSMSRALKAIGARRGRPRPRVRCPWSKRAKGRRLRQIRQMLRDLPKGHVAVYEDEVDIDLNPKIGFDWMVRGQQKAVLTPGQNVKRYVAGALDAVTGRVVWVEGRRKNSDLFVTLLKRLVQVYAGAKVIHVVLDNYRIHASQITKKALQAFGGKVLLHFLPPYCPNHNKIERLWRDLHDQVTRNHRCASMEELMRRVRRFLRRRNAAAKTRLTCRRRAALRSAA
jgi:transposase